MALPKRRMHNNQVVRVLQSCCGCGHSCGGGSEVEVVGVGGSKGRFCCSAVDEILVVMKNRP
jgi:hypothetical protein